MSQEQNTDRDKWISIGEKAVSKFETWKGYSSWNFENKHLLLSAELLCVKGNYGAAEEHYKASILSAQLHRFVHEEGLAWERLGMTYEEIGRAESAREMLATARNCYERWGASAVVARLDSKLTK
jgi:tetratricopeptide (TPR) repeat protein